MTNITPFLWFDTQAEQAARFYTSIFPNSAITGVSYYEEGGPGPGGSVMVASFTLNGKPFMALNGGPTFQFSPAISFLVGCDTQDEIDYCWEKLSDGGQTLECGWLTDRFGVSWQIVPSFVERMLASSEPERTKRVTAALWKMTKLDLAVLQAAYDDEGADGV